MGRNIWRMVGFSLYYEEKKNIEMTFKLLEMSTLIEMDFFPEESGSELLIIHAEQDVLELERSIYVWSDKYYLTFSPGKVFQRMTFLSPCSPKPFQIWSHCFPRH